MKFVPARVSRFASRQGLIISKNSPTIFLGAGIVGVIGTAVLASRATLNAAPILEATHMELEQLKYNVDKAQDDTGIRMPEPEIRKVRVQIYAKTAGQLTKLYAPAIVVGGLSIGCLVQSHRILNDRYSNLSAAYLAMQESLEAYRRRVRGEVGEEKERDLFYAGRDETMIEMGPNGPKKTTRRVFGDGGGSIYARLFNAESSTEFKNTPEFNTMFLRQVEKACNLRLRTEGHLFLNSVFEELGMEHTTAGAVCGWLYERGTGNDFVDFGIWNDDMKDRMYDFMVGNEGEIMLDFNVDGEIYKMLSLPKVR